MKKELMPIPIPLFIDARRAGNTIRIVDYLIQKLFMKGWCSCWDHFRDADNPHTTIEMKKMVMKMVLRRLSIEHNLNEDNFLEVDRREYVIKLKKGLITHN